MSDRKNCYDYSPDGLCGDCRKEALTPKGIRQTLRGYEALCERADRIATAYILATAKDKGQIESYTPTFEFPEACEDLEKATYTAEWTETWAYGGIETHYESIPFRLLMMPEEEALTEIQAIKEAKEQERAEQERKKAEAQEARCRAQYEKLHAEYGGEA